VPELDEVAIVVRRFDRAPDGQKLRLEDCGQILVKPRGPDYSGKYEASYEDIAALLREYSARPEIDVSRFFQRIIAFAVVGNCDAHLKNFSLLETDTGLRLSPAYDVVNTACYDGYSQSFALAIGGSLVQLEAIDRKLLEDFGHSIKLPPTAIRRAFQQLGARARHAQTTLLKPPAGEGPEGFVTRYAEIVSRGCLRILNE
jgi:serine/threonine-protein kinase HipA